MIITNKGKQTIQSSIEQCLKKCSSTECLEIASAFFSQSNLLLEMARTNQVKIVLRLEEGTNYKEVVKIFNKHNIQIRFFRGDLFHPKFFIMGNQAIIGSANCTGKGLNNNYEACILLHDFEGLKDLRMIFDQYWLEAKELTMLELEDFKKRSKSFHRSTSYKASKNDSNKGTPSNSVMKYLEFKAEFEILRVRYQAFKQRKYTEDLVPINLEIDKYLYWLQHNKKAEILRSSNTSLEKTILEFINSPDESEKEAIEHAMKIKANNPFSRPSSTDEEKLSWLYNIYSFKQYQRRFAKSAGAKLFKANKSDAINKFFDYLLNGNDEPLDRLKTCLEAHGDHKLEGFGASSITELFGCYYIDEYPIKTSTAEKGINIVKSAFFPE